MKTKGINEILLGIYIRLPYFEGISKIRGVSKREALKIAQTFRKEMIGFGIRDVYKTVDSRQLLKEILGLIALYCSNLITKNRILSLTPYLDANKLKDRLKLLSEAFEELEKKAEVISKFKEILKS